MGLASQRLPFPDHISRVVAPRTRISMRAETVRRLSEMVLVIVCALVFLSAAFTIRPAFPLIVVLSPPPPLKLPPQLPPPRGVTVEGKDLQGRSAPMAPADPVLAPAPYPPPPSPDRVNERGRIPHLSGSRVFGL